MITSISPFNVNILTDLAVTQNDNNIPRTQDISESFFRGRSSTKWDSLHEERSFERNPQQIFVRLWIGYPSRLIWPFLDQTLFPNIIDAASTVASLHYHIYFRRHHNYLIQIPIHEMVPLQEEKYSLPSEHTVYKLSCYSLAHQEGQIHNLEIQKLRVHDMILWFNRLEVRSLENCIVCTLPIVVGTTLVVMSNSLSSVDVFASLKSLEFCCKMAADELKMLPNETLGAGILLER